MIEFSGLDLRIDEGNEIIIDENCNFVTSRIYVQGKGNRIIIDKALLHQSLFIKIRGDNKEIVIGETKKNIANLKIVSIRGEKQKVAIGKDFSCGGLEIQMNDGYENLIIGDDCLFSWGLKMRTSDGHSVVDIETGKAINLPKDIKVGNHVWIGEDVKLLKGVLIPNNTIVGSFSVVTKDFTQENTVIGGYPAKVLKENVSWDRRMPYEFNK